MTQSASPTLEQQIEEMVHRETRAWDAQDAQGLADLFHPDMVWPWPPTAEDHDPESWVFFLGRYDRARWAASWQGLFDTHALVHNRRVIQKILMTEQRDGGMAVVDIDTLWRNRNTGAQQHWFGRVSKVYTRLGSGDWKLIMHTGVLHYPTAEPARHVAK